MGFIMKRLKLCIFFLIVLAGALMACANDRAGSGKTAESSSIETKTIELLPLETETWKEAYAGLLRKSEGKEFFLCDIDGKGIPELLIEGLTDNARYTFYDVYTCKNNMVECLGEINTRASLALDNKGGILGYGYGAGAGAAYRFYINNGEICYDGEIYGYYYEGNGDEPEDNLKEWFRGSDGNSIIVTEETEYEYQYMLGEMIGLEGCIATEDNIEKVIYG